jgi:hypothetical protein
MRKRWSLGIGAAIVGILIVSAVGSGPFILGTFVNAYTDEPNERIEQLLKNDEELRQLNEKWEKIWGDQPGDATPGKVPDSADGS